MTPLEKFKRDWNNTLISMGIILLIGLALGTYSYLTTPKTTELTDCILSDLEDGAWSIDRNMFLEKYYVNKSRGLRIDVRYGLIESDSLIVVLTEDEMIYVSEAIKNHIEQSSRKQFIKNCK